MRACLSAAVASGSDAVVVGGEREGELDVGLAEGARRPLRARHPLEQARGCRGPIAPSGFGRHQIGVRWKTVRCSTSGAIVGITCTAEAPVPTIATRLPRRSTLVVPAGGVHHGAGEVVEPGDVGRLGLGEDAGRADDVARRDRRPFGDLEPPEVRLRRRTSRR